MSDNQQLADRLVAGNERWGWRHEPPAPPVPPALEEPVWIPPVSRDTSSLEVVQGCGIGCLVVGVVFAGAVSCSTAVGMTSGGIQDVFTAMVICVICLAVSVGPIAIVRPMLRAAKAKADAEQQQASAWFANVHAEWQRRVAEHVAAEAARFAGTPAWLPVSFSSQPARIDVVGGTPDGWASLLTTLGTSVMLRAHGITVVDLTDEDIAGDLAQLVERRGRVETAETAETVEAVDLGGGEEPLAVIDGMSGFELAEMLATAAHGMRGQGGSVELRALDADLLQTVVDALDSRLTFRRLVAGLQVLRRTYDVTASGPLTPDEVTALTAKLDAAGQGERVTQELQFLTSTLNLAAATATPRDDPGIVSQTLVEGDGLRIFRTAHGVDRSKNFLDRLLLARLMHDLRRAERKGVQATLVLAGVDNIGFDALESLAKQCERAGIRLILMLRQLRGELKDLLGSGGSAAVLMQLGNARDALTAAEFIGRNHKFVVSQLTEQAGETISRGTSDSVGGSTGTSETTGVTTTRGRSVGHGVSVDNSRMKAPGDVGIGTPRRTTNRSVNKSRSTAESQSTTLSRSESWQRSVSDTVAQSATSSVAESRVYDLAVEPTKLQSLPVTAFVLVESHSSTRRVVLGDCNPGIALLNPVIDQSITS